MGMQTIEKQSSSRTEVSDVLEQIRYFYFSLISLEQINRNCRSMSSSNKNRNDERKYFLSFDRSNFRLLVNMFDRRLWS